MSVHSPAALARSGACSIQTISSRSLPGTVTARPRLTRSAKRTRIITQLYPGHSGQTTGGRHRNQRNDRGHCLQGKESITRLRHQDEIEWSDRDEYTVLGSRWMDCIGRVVTRPSDWEHRESTTCPVKPRGNGRASRERSRYNACSSSGSAERSDPGDWGCGRTGTGYARGDPDEKLGLAKFQKAFAGKCRTTAQSRSAIFPQRDSCRNLTSISSRLTLSA